MSLCILSKSSSSSCFSFSSVAFSSVFSLWSLLTSRWSPLILSSIGRLSRSDLSKYSCSISITILLLASCSLFNLQFPENSLFTNFFWISFLWFCKKEICVVNALTVSSNFCFSPFNIFLYSRSRVIFNSSRLWFSILSVAAFSSSHLTFSFFCCTSISFTFLSVTDILRLKSSIIDCNFFPSEDNLSSKFILIREVSSSLSLEALWRIVIFSTSWIRESFSISCL